MVVVSGDLDSMATMPGRVLPHRPLHRGAPQRSGLPFPPLLLVAADAFEERGSEREIKMLLPPAVGLSLTVIS
jgi:hypothetical protein